MQYQLEDQPSSFKFFSCFIAISNKFYVKEKNNYFFDYVDIKTKIIFAQRMSRILFNWDRFKHCLREQLDIFYFHEDLFIGKLLRKHGKSHTNFGELFGGGDHNFFSL